MSVHSNMPIAPVCMYVNSNYIDFNEKLDFNDR